MDKSVSTNVNPTSSWDERKRDTRWWDAGIYRGNSGFCAMHTNAEGGEREREGPATNSFLRGRW